YHHIDRQLLDRPDSKEGVQHTAVIICNDDVIISVDHVGHARAVVGLVENIKSFGVIYLDIVIPCCAVTAIDKQNFQKSVVSARAGSIGSSAGYRNRRLITQGII